MNSISTIFRSSIDCWPIIYIIVNWPLVFDWWTNTIWVTMICRWFYLCLPIDKWRRAKLNSMQRRKLVFRNCFKNILNVRLSDRSILIDWHREWMQLARTMMMMITSSPPTTMIPIKKILVRQKRSFVPVIPPENVEENKNLFIPYFIYFPLFLLHIYTQPRPFIFIPDVWFDRHIFCILFLKHIKEKEWNIRCIPTCTWRKKKAFVLITKLVDAWE